MERLGDFQENTIVCGDCLDIMAAMPNGCVDLVVTDPPYGINLVPQRKLTSSFIGDDNTEARQLWGKAIPELYRVLAQNSVAFIFTRWSEIDWVKPLVETQFKIKSLIVWVKNNWGIGFYTRPQHEFILYCWKGIPPTPKKKVSDVWRFARVLAPQHAAEKPVALIAECIRFGSNFGDLIFDPFIGSGTTAEASLILNRSYFGCDISVDYVEMAHKRIKKYTEKYGMRLF